MHIRVKLWRTVRERRSPGYEIDVAAKASHGVAMPQPRRVDAHGRDMAGFANLDVRYRLGQLRDVIFDVSVELLSNGSNRSRAPLNEMPLSSGRTSLSKAVACRYGRWLAHFAWRYSSSGVARFVRALDKGWTTHRGVLAVRWQAHDHSRGLCTVTLPYTVRITVERLSLCLNVAPQH